MDRVGAERVNLQPVVAPPLLRLVLDAVVHHSYAVEAHAPYDGLGGTRANGHRLHTRKVLQHTRQRLTAMLLHQSRIHKQDGLRMDGIDRMTCRRHHVHIPQTQAVRNLTER